MGPSKETFIDRIRQWFWQKRYDIGMWLVVRCIYPDADPSEFKVLDTKHFVAIERHAARDTWQNMTEDERQYAAWHAMTGE